MKLMVRGSVWNFLVVAAEVVLEVEDLEVGEEEEAMVVVAVVAAEVAVVLLPDVLITVSWFLVCLLLVAGKISRIICVMLVMFSSQMFLKMELALWSFPAMMT